MGQVSTGKPDALFQAPKEEPKKPVFSPNKNYGWEPTDQFTLDGQEFSILLSTLRAAATNPGGAPAIQVAAAHRIVEDLLILGVEEGVIKEKVDEGQVIDAIPLPGE